MQSHSNGRRRSTKVSALPGVSRTLKIYRSVTQPLDRAVEGGLARMQSSQATATAANSDDIDPIESIVAQRLATEGVCAPLQGTVAACAYDFTGNTVGPVGTLYRSADLAVERHIGGRSIGGKPVGAASDGTGRNAASWGNIGCTNADKRRRRGSA